MGLITNSKKLELMTQSLHSDDYSNFVRIITGARKRMGLTHQQVADVLGKPQSYIVKIERNERRVDIVEFVAIAKAMNCDEKKLFAEFSNSL